MHLQALNSSQMLIYLLSSLVRLVLSDPLIIRPSYIVYLGHSERRTLFHETSALVAQKTHAALGQALRVILCVGETLHERESGETVAVVEDQLKAVVALLQESDWGCVSFIHFPSSALTLLRLAILSLPMSLYGQSGLERWLPPLRPRKLTPTSALSSLKRSPPPWRRMPESYMAAASMALTAASWVSDA